MLTAEEREMLANIKALLAQIEQMEKPQEEEEEQLVAQAVKAKDEEDATGEMNNDVDEKNPDLEGDNQDEQFEEEGQSEEEPEEDEEVKKIAKMLLNMAGNKKSVAKNKSSLDKLKAIEKRQEKIEKALLAIVEGIGIADVAKGADTFSTQRRPIVHDATGLRDLLKAMQEQSESKDTDVRKALSTVLQAIGQYYK